MPVERHYITQAHERDIAIAALSTTNVIGVDIEGDSLYRYSERVALIQISGGDQHYIFDPFLLDSVLELGPLFANRGILKIFHGAEYDVTSLKRDFGFTIGPIFDTALAARATGMARWSLKELVSSFFGVILSKTYQKSNWSLRPLSQEQLDYAAEDTAYLPTLHTLLSETVAQKGRTDQIAEECRLMENLTGTRRPFIPDDYLRIKGAHALSPEAQKIFRALITARDRLARERDIPPFKVVPSNDLLTLAVERPESAEAMTKLFRKGSLVREMPVWLEAIQEGAQSDIPLPRKAKKKGAPMTNGQQRLLARLKNWRDQQSRLEGVDAAMILTTPVLQEIAKKRPCTLEALEAISAIHQWQINHYGQKLVDTVVAREGNTRAPEPANE